MNSSTLSRTTRTIPATRNSPARASRIEGASRIADYIVDVFFIALLAAPFLIFQSPASVQEAVGSARAADTAVVVTAAAPAPATPPSAASAYGPE